MPGITFGIKSNMTRTTNRFFQHNKIFTDFNTFGKSVRNKCRRGNSIGDKNTIFKRKNTSPHFVKKNEYRRIKWSIKNTVITTRLNNDYLLSLQTSRYVGPDKKERQRFSSTPLLAP